MVFLYLTNIRFIVNAEGMTLLCHHFVVYISIIHEIYNNANPSGLSNSTNNSNDKLILNSLL